MKTPESAQQQVLQAAAERYDVTLAPALLQAVFTYCAEVLAPPSLAVLNRVDLLRLLTDVSNVLLQSKTTLTTVTDSALEQAMAGSRLRDALREGEALLTSKAQEIARAREALTPLLRQEETLRAQAAEYDTLKRRQAELERLATLIQHSGELPRQVEALSQRLTQAGAETLQWEQRIGEQAQSLIVLSAATLAALEPRAQQALAEAQRLENAYRAAAAQLQEAHTRAQQMESDLQRINQQLQPHLMANQTVAQALPKEITPHALLDEVERLLRQADEALQKALTTQAETRRLMKLPLMERQHERPA